MRCNALTLHADAKAAVRDTPCYAAHRQDCNSLCSNDPLLAVVTIKTGNEPVYNAQVWWPGRQPGEGRKGSHLAPAETNSRCRQRFGGGAERDGDGPLPEGRPAIWTVVTAIEMGMTPIRMAMAAIWKAPSSILPRSAGEDATSP